MEVLPIKDVKKGAFIRFSPSESAPVWVRGEYDRTAKKYEVYKYEDVNHTAFLKGSRLVITDFIY